MLRLLRSLAGLLLTGIAVEAALTPIGLYHFHKAGLYGTFANIVAIPLTTFVIMPAEALALLLDLVHLGAPVWWIAGQALHLLLVIAHRTGEAAGAVALLPAMADAAFLLMVGGGLWLALWRTKWRRWGAVPFAAGAVWALLSPTPDLLVTGDGRHVAFRAADGSIGILRTRARDYVRDTLAESLATNEELPDVDDLKGAACSDDFCLVTLWRDGRAVDDPRDADEDAVRPAAARRGLRRGRHRHLRTPPAERLRAALAQDRAAPAAQDRRPLDPARRQPARRLPWPKGWAAIRGASTISRRPTSSEEPPSMASAAPIAAASVRARKRVLRRVSRGRGGVRPSARSATSRSGGSRKDISTSLVDCGGIVGTDKGTFWLDEAKVAEHTASRRKRAAMIFGGVLAATAAVLGFTQV